MLTGADRAFAVVTTVDQWTRSLHADTTIVDGCVQLAPRPSTPAATHEPAPRAGLAFDAACRLLRTDPVAGTLHRHRWTPGGAAGPVRVDGDAVSLDAGATPPVVGDFALQAGGPAAPAPIRLGALAVTDDGLAHVVDHDGETVITLDPGTGRILRRAAVAPACEPAPLVDLAGQGAAIWVLAGPVPPAAGVGFVPAGAAPTAGPASQPFVLARAAYGADLVLVPLPASAAEAPAGSVPVAVTIGGDGRPIVLLRTPDGTPLVAIAGHRALLVPAGLSGATDVGVDGTGALVIAGAVGEPFARLTDEDGRYTAAAPLDGTGYDGSGIVTTPDGRIAFWTAGGLRIAFPVRSRLETAGHVTTYRLDAGEPGTRWGRLFVEACVPEGTRLTVLAVSGEPGLEEPPDGTFEAWAPPPGVDVTGIDPDDTPPQVPVADAVVLAGIDGAPLHRRATGRELAWSHVDGDDPFRVYDAPILAEPGRFLWVRLVLAGSGRWSPRVRALRVERPGHDLLQRLPRSWSRDEGAAGFLQRYLAPAEGELAGLRARAASRHLLVDPRTAPDDALDWLAGFVGLTVDRRIDSDRRRALIAAATQLFARRGTVGGLRLLLALATGVDVIVVERFRVRGLGGALLDDEVATAASWPVVGAGFRVGGAVSPATGAPAATAPSADAFATHAHRFSVIVPASLTSEQLDLLHDLLDEHRPAHTVVDVCTVDAGSRVGVGLHLELSSIVGRSGGFDPITVGDAVLGRDQALGTAASGVRPGGATIGAAHVGWGG